MHQETSRFHFDNITIEGHKQTLVIKDNKSNFTFAKYHVASFNPNFKIIRTCSIKSMFAITFICLAAFALIGIELFNCYQCGMIIINLGSLGMASALLLLSYIHYQKALDKSFKGYIFERSRKNHSFEKVFDAGSNALSIPYNKAKLSEIQRLSNYIKKSI